MRPIASDSAVGGNALMVDWIRVTPYASTGAFTSRVMDAGSSLTWTSATWNTDLPAGSSVAITIRFGDTPAPDASWTAFTPLGTSGSALVNATARYVQYTAVMTTSSTGQTPTLKDVTVR